jgi:hypothetical protein
MVGKALGKALAPLTRMQPGHISAPIVSMAIALILLRFWLLNLELLNSHSLADGP